MNYTDRLPIDNSLIQEYNTSLLPLYQMWLKYGITAMYFIEDAEKYIPVFSIKLINKPCAGDKLESLETPYSLKTLRKYNLTGNHHLTGSLAITKDKIESVISLIMRFFEYNEASRVFLVFCYMYDNCVRFQNFSRSQKYIAEELHISINSVGAALRFLVDQNYLSIVKQASYNEKDLHNNSREYAINRDLIPLELQDKNWLIKRTFLAKEENTDVGIYTYTNKTTGQKYIGSSMNLTLRRQTESQMDTFFAKELRADPNNFEYEVVENCNSDITIKELHTKEARWIYKYHCDGIKIYNTYNPEQLTSLGNTDNADKVDWKLLVSQLKDKMSLSDLQQIAIQNNISVAVALELYLTNKQNHIAMLDEDGVLQGVFDSYAVATAWLVKYQNVSKVFLNKNLFKAIASNSSFAYHKWALTDDVVSLDLTSEKFIPEDYKTKPVKCIDTGDTFLNSSIAAHALGKTNGGLIIRNCRGLCKSAFGYKWEFVNNPNNEIAKSSCQVLKKVL